MSERLGALSNRESEKPDVSDLTGDLGQAALLLVAETADHGSVNGSVRQPPLANRDQGQFNEVGDETTPPQRTRSTTNKRKPVSDETRAKISQANKGRPVSDETRAKMSKANKGKRLSDETKAMLSEMNRGENNPRFGRRHSDETKAKMSKAKKGQRHSNESRAKMSKAKKGKRHSQETKAKMSASQKARHVAARRSPWEKVITEEEKLAALLPCLGPIERQIVVRSWGRDGHTPQSVDQITQQLFGGAPIWRAKVQGTIQSVRSLISGFEYPQQPTGNNRSQTPRDLRG